ncbi:MAG: hypothetical protein PHY94_06745 [Candidatus Omnitrophica bacterium]|nr:hypothetical protein [Candidatus Omnitrophota bacterium]
MLNKRLGLLLLVSLLTAGPLLAADNFDLSYLLEDGGFSLQLNQAYPFKGVTLQVNSNVSTRYEVRQKLINPIQSRTNPGQTLQENFVFRGLRGTNKFGNLRIPVTDSSMRQDELLYVSDNIGSADSFTLAYGITKIEDLAPGQYFGRIAFVLNPIASARPQVTKILDVYITISREAGQKPVIEISAVNGGKTISLNPNKEGMQSADVLFKINGNFAQPFKIIQMLNRPLESLEGNKLERGAVNFVVKEARVGVGLSRITPLSSGMQEIYSSAAGGNADNYFLTSYSLADFSGQKAGKFITKIDYILEAEGAQTRLDAIDLEIENERVFDLKITPADQRYAIAFENVKPLEPPRESEVAIEVMSNTGKRYQVTQDVLADLTNKEGGTIPSQYFALRTETLESKGIPRIAQWEEVKKGSTVVFVSDNQGSADKFKIKYRLESPKDLKMGDYSTRITYSLSEL